MSNYDYDTLPMFDLKKILNERGIPFAENITKLEVLTLLKSFNKQLFQSYAEIMAEVVEVKELIGGIIQAGCTCQLFGPSGDGKTSIAIDFSLSVATGTDWNGLPCKQGLVVYFNGEGRQGFKLRLKAWQRYHGITGRVDFYASKQVVTFDASGLDLAVTEIQRIEQQSGQKVSLIVVDTLARHLIGDENSTRDMSDFIRQVDGMRDLFPDSTALIVHHTGNNSEARCHSVCIIDWVLEGRSCIVAIADYESHAFAAVAVLLDYGKTTVIAVNLLGILLCRLGGRDDRR